MTFETTSSNGTISRRFKPPPQDLPSNNGSTANHHSAKNHHHPTNDDDDGQNKQRRDASFTMKLRRQLYRGRSIVILWVTFYLFILCVTYVLSGWKITASRCGDTRRRCRGQDPEIPILIPLPRNNKGTPRRRKLQFHPPPPPLVSTKNHLERDYGALEYKPLQTFEKGRIIHRDDSDDESGHVYESGDFEDGNDDWLDPYYEFDDDVVDGDVDVNCRRVSWYEMYNPVCNMFHELGFLKYKMISSGYYRNVWHYPRKRLILKSLKYKHPFTETNYEYIRKDALVMSLLASSPRIVNIYGHCATSVYTEVMQEDLEEAAVFESGHVDQDELEDEEDVNPQNDFTPREKLVMALEMAESLADLHGFEGGVIVHDDVQPSQWLWDDEEGGILRLNDFNRAEIMFWNVEKEEYCKYQNGEVWGTYRSPEEIADDPLNEKIDVFSLGNNMYVLLTGLWNFYDTEEDDIVKKRVTNRELPYIDKRYRTRSYAEGALVQIMERCWVYEPEDRVDVFEIIRFLKEAIKEHDRLEALGDKTSLNGDYDSGEDF